MMNTRTESLHQTVVYTNALVMELTRMESVKRDRLPCSPKKPVGMDSYTIYSQLNSTLPHAEDQASTTLTLY